MRCSRKRSATGYASTGIRSAITPLGCGSHHCPFYLRMSPCPNLKHLAIGKELGYSMHVGATRRFTPIPPVASNPQECRNEVNLEARSPKLQSRSLGLPPRYLPFSILAVYQRDGSNSARGKDSSPKVRRPFTFSTFKKAA